MDKRELNQDIFKNEIVWRWRASLWRSDAKQGISWFIKVLNCEVKLYNCKYIQILEVEREVGGGVSRGFFLQKKHYPWNFSLLGELGHS